MSQSLPLIDTPKVIARAREHLSKTQSRLSSAKKRVEVLSFQLRIAGRTAGSLENDLITEQKAFVLLCCKTLEQLMAQAGQGWCPLCQRVVALEKLSFAYTARNVHVDEHYGDHGYGGGTPARDYTEYTSYRVPHDCRRALVVETPMNNATYGGSIADAPPEVFATYGIPAIDPELLQAARPGIWEFLERA